MKKWKQSTSLLLLSAIFFLNAAIHLSHEKTKMVILFGVCAIIELVSGIYYRNKEKKAEETEQEE